MKPTRCLRANSYFMLCRAKDIRVRLRELSWCGPVPWNLWIIFINLLFLVTNTSAEVTLLPCLVLCSNAGTQNCFRKRYISLPYLSITYISFHVVRRYEKNKLWFHFLLSFIFLKTPELAARFVFCLSKKSCVGKFIIEGLQLSQLTELWTRNLVISACFENICVSKVIFSVSCFSKTKIASACNVISGWAGKTKWFWRSLSDIYSVWYQSYVNCVDHGPVNKINGTFCICVKNTLRGLCVTFCWMKQHIFKNKTRWDDCVPFDRLNGHFVP